MNADDTPTTQDDAVERFAAAVDGGDGDPELAREMEVVDLLTRHGGALDPDAATKARARARLMAALADDGPSRAS